MCVACVACVWGVCVSSQRWPVVTKLWQKPGIRETWCHLVSSNLYSWVLLRTCVCVHARVCMCVKSSWDTSWPTPGRLHERHTWTGPMSEPRVMRRQRFTSPEIHYLLRRMDDKHTHRKHTHTHRWFWHNESWALLFQALDGAVSQYQGQGQRRRCGGSGVKKKEGTYKKWRGKQENDKVLVANYL